MSKSELFNGVKVSYTEPDEQYVDDAITIREPYLEIPPSGKRDLLWRKIITHTASPDPATGCWVWQKGNSGSGRGGGYGRVYFDGQMIAVHRAVYLIVHGYLHKRQQVDHTCENRLCVNPDHLEAVSASENMKRVHRRKSQKCTT